MFGFDTGFVCYHRGWHELRPDDLGLLWQHLVLNELYAHAGSARVHYWRSKHGNEVDFVLVARGRPPAAIERKWSARDFDAANLRAFRNRYPRGQPGPRRRVGSGAAVALDAGVEGLASTPRIDSTPGTNSAWTATSSGRRAAT